MHKTEVALGVSPHWKRKHNFGRKNLEKRVRGIHQVDIAWCSIRILYGLTEIRGRIHVTQRIDILEAEVLEGTTDIENARRLEVSETGEVGTNIGIEIAIATAIAGGKVLDSLS